MTLWTLVPTSVEDTASELPAARPASLDGATMGVYANVKVNADKFLDALTELIQRDHRIARIVRRTEGEIGMGADGPYDELAAQCDFVITALGD